MFSASSSAIEPFRFNFVLDQQDGQDDHHIQDDIIPSDTPIVIPPHATPDSSTSVPLPDTTSLLPAREHSIKDLSLITPISVHINTLSINPGLSFYQCHLQSVSAQLSSITDRSDVVSHVYEGGFKVWECANDLSTFLHQSREQQQSSNTLNYDHVLDLGCGQGFNGIYSLIYGDAKSVTFQDLNEEVLLNVTMRNVWENVNRTRYQSSTHNDNTDRDIVTFISTHTRFISGDWYHPSLFTLLTQHSYTLILSADTLYSPSTIPHLLSILYHCLHPHGVIIIASKRYYFGIGGGTLILQRRIESDGKFNCSILKVIEDGRSNIREILKLTWKSHIS